MGPIARQSWSWTSEAQDGKGTDNLGLVRSSVHAVSWFAANDVDMRDMADGNADSELAALRDVLGHTLDDAELKKLLNRAGNNAGVALNLHYDQATAATGGNLAQKRPAPSLPGFFETRQKYPKTDNSIAIDEKDANSERKHASTIGSLQEKPATAACASSATTPLAERMRPKVIQELLGQEDALGSVLRQAVREDHLPSLILWGPPGCGKTSFAHCVAAGTKRAFRSLSAAKAVPVTKQCMSKAS